MNAFSAASIAEFDVFYIKTRLLKYNYTQDSNIGRERLTTWCTTFVKNKGKSFRPAITIPNYSLAKSV